MTRIAAWLFSVLLSLAPAWAADGPKCAIAPLLLWGDGEHDDTAALNAWFRGDEVAWAQTGRSVGAEIAGRVFRLSAAVYIPSGTGRTIERFRLIWPERKERVSGGAIRTGVDPDRPPLLIGISTIGSGPGEGVPFEVPDPPPADRDSGTNCVVS